MHLLQVLLAWNTNTVLVSFRGTASLANALADIQVGLAALSLLPYTLSCIAAVPSAL